MPQYIWAPLFPLDMDKEDKVETSAPERGRWGTSWGARGPSYVAIGPWHRRKEGPGLGEQEEVMHTDLWTRGDQG